MREMYQQRRDPKAELKNCGLFLLKAIGLALGGAVMFVLATATGTIFPGVAIVAGLMVLMGGLGVVLALLMAVFWLFQLRAS